jgi:hypothetical protein
MASEGKVSPLRDGAAAGSSLPPTRPLLLPAGLLETGRRDWRLPGNRIADGTKDEHVDHLDLTGGVALRGSCSLAAACLAAGQPRSHIAETRIRTSRAILANLHPEPVRVALPPPKVYAPPRATAARRRRAGR